MPCVDQPPTAIVNTPISVPRRANAWPASPAIRIAAGRIQVDTAAVRKHECDHAFGDAGLLVLVSGDQHPRMDEGSSEKSRSLEEPEGSNCPSNRVGQIALSAVREQRG